MASVATPSSSSQKDVNRNPPPFFLENEEKFRGYTINVNPVIEPVAGKVGAVGLPSGQTLVLQKKSCLQKVKDVISYIWKVFLAIVTCGKKPFPACGEVVTDANKKAAQTTSDKSQEKTSEDYTITHEFVWGSDKIGVQGFNSMIRHMLGSMGVAPIQLSAYTKKYQEKYYEVLYRLPNKDQVQSTRFVLEKEIKGEVKNLVFRVLWDSKEKQGFKSEELFKEPVPASLRSDPLMMISEGKGVYLPIGGDQEQSLLSESLRKLGITEADKGKIPEIISDLKEAEYSIFNEEVRRHVSDDGLVRVQMCDFDASEAQSLGLPRNAKQLTITILPANVSGSYCLEVNNIARNNPVVGNILIEGGAKRLHIERVFEGFGKIAYATDQREVIGFRFFITDVKS